MKKHEVENSVTEKTNNCNESQAFAGKDIRLQSLQKTANVNQHKRSQRNSEICIFFFWK